jgi:hypothetical protein
VVTQSVLTPITESCGDVNSLLRDSIGASAIAGDLRWAGSFGANIDFVARSHCSVEIILLEDMVVSDHSCPLSCEEALAAAVLAVHEKLKIIYICTWYPQK